MQYMCRGCAERYPGCHADCESYQAATRQKRVLDDRRRTEQEYVALVCSRKIRKDGRHCGTNKRRDML